MRTFGLRGFGTLCVTTCVISTTQHTEFLREDDGGFYHTLHLELVHKGEKYVCREPIISTMDE